ncbi:S-layer homology domain-containing protein [Paenibacillus macerans]|uniref:S-layer homology domain-containing protein n=1 Tax=Paenibacillus macerans TaxID=44252 RepID=UPI002041B67B|nr:S-layer homology domain-containing protein [Paenibacillus macerans]MCM3697985.1 S-layer homology domain-containing protein [Paenibacillus macerans]
MGRGIKHKAALALLAVLLLIPVSPLAGPGRAFAASELPADLKDHWAEEALSSWLEQGLISGYADGKVKPDQPVTRAEWMAMVNGRFGFNTEGGTTSFKDVQPTAWFAADAAAAAQAGYITGYADGTLRPNAPVTRAEAAVMLSRLGMLEPLPELASFKDALQAWSKGEIGAVVGAGWMNDYPDGMFRGAEALTRAEAVVTLDRAFGANLAAKNESLSGDMDRPGVYGPAEGSAEIAGDAFIKADGITLQNTIIKGNLTLTEEIGSGEVRLAGVTVEGELRINGGGPNTVYLQDTGAKRLTVNKKDGQVRIVASGNTTLETAVLSSGVILEESELTGEGQGFVLIDVSSQVPKSSVVQLRGTAETVRIEASGIRFELLSGQIDRLEVESGAVSNVIYLAQGTKVIVAELNSAVTFEGPGQVLQKLFGNGVPVDRGRSHGGGGSTTPTTPTKPTDPGPTDPTDPTDPPDPEPTVTELVYSPRELKFDAVRVDASVTLKAMLTDGKEIDVTDAASWFTENTAVATVINGTVTSQGAGETWIGAKYGGLTMRIPVKVEIASTPTPTVTELVYSPGELKFEDVGEEVGVTLKAVLSDGTEMDVTRASAWFTEDETVATVAGGTVTSQGQGETWIGAEYRGLTIRIPVKVTVVPEVTPAYRVTLSGKPDGPVAGSDIHVTLRVEKSDGSLDTDFSGMKKLTLAGVKQAPDGSYGSLAGTSLTDITGEADVQFESGEAQIAITLNKADAQLLTLTVEGVAQPTAELAITLAPAAAAELRIVTQPSESVASGEIFRVQPVIRVLDAFGNLTNEPLTVTASVGNGAATLMGTAAVQTVDGIASYTDLKLAGDNSAITLQFTAGSLPAVSSTPIAVHAFWSGDGTAGSPYVITSAAQLDNVRNHLNGHFVLGGDIDLSGYSSGEGWVPIGTSGAAFTGTLDGQGYTIRHLTSLRQAGMMIGLFGYIDGANITNLNLSDVNVLGFMNVGGLAGYMKSGSLSGVHAEHVTINGASNLVQYAGGLLGRLEGGTLNRSSATDVNLNATFDLGGLVGATNNSSFISESYSTGEVMANGQNLGGLVGTNYGLITDSYSLVNITGGSSAVGGLIGQSRGIVINSYAAGSINSAGVVLGGLSGDNMGSVLGSYYDSDTTGQTDTGKGTPKTTAEMQQPFTFVGWNFSSIWAIDAGGYPYLRWQRP